MSQVVECQQEQAIAGQVDLPPSKKQAWAKSTKVALACARPAVRKGRGQAAPHAGKSAGTLPGGGRRTWRTPHQDTKSRMMGAKKMTEATSGMGRTPGNSARQPDSSGRYGAPAGTQGCGSAVTGESGGASVAHTRSRSPDLQKASRAHSGPMHGPSTTQLVHRCLQNAASGRST